MSSRNIMLFVGIAMLLLITLREELTLVSDRFGSITDGGFEHALPESTIWTEPEEVLEFDESGEETQEWIEKQNETFTEPSELHEPSKPDETAEPAEPAEPSLLSADFGKSSRTEATKLPVITEILPSKNSNRTLASLWGDCTNATLEKREKITYGIHVIMSFYKGSYGKDRFHELLTSLKRNLRNPHVTAVHALWEDRDPIIYVNSSVLEKKLVRVHFGVQPTYKDFFDYANLRLGRGAIGIVTNSDIYFDETLECVTPVTEDRKAYNATKQHLVYALSRHASPPCITRADYCDSYIGSHDAFLFALPLPLKFSSKLDFTQNHIAAENVVIWEFKRQEGYVVRNPCHAVRCYHIHCTNERHYRMGAISRGRNRIGPVDRHASVIPSKLRCGQVVY